jgi:hypothetical protein
MTIYFVLWPNSVAVINQSLRFYIVLETKGKGAEKASQWTRLI